MTSTPPDESSKASIRPEPGGFPAKARLWDRVPWGLKWGIAFVVIGFFVSVSYTVHDNGECTYTDIGKGVFATLAVIAVVMGCRQEFVKTRDRLRLGKVPTLVIAGLVVLLACYEIIVSLGIFGGPCS